MATAQPAGDDLATGLRWLARFLGLLTSGLFLLFIVGSGAKIYPTLSWTSPRGMPLLIVLGIAVLGVLIAWRWELAGGAMALGGAIVLSVLVRLGSDRIVSSTASLIVLPFFVVGFLYLTCCWRTRAVAGRKI